MPIGKPKYPRITIPTSMIIPMAVSILLLVDVIVKRVLLLMLQSRIKYFI